MENLLELVRRLRSVQKEYYRFKTQANLKKARIAESQIDEILKQIDNYPDSDYTQRGLFDEEPHDN